MHLLATPMLVSTEENRAADFGGSVKYEEKRLRQQ